MDQREEQRAMDRIEAAACPFCGKLHTLPLYVEYTAPLDAETWAAENCDCPEAVEQRLLQRANEQIRDLFEDYEEMQGLLYDAARLVCRDTVEAVAVRADCQTEAKIFKNGKGLLIVTKKRKIERQATIG